MNDNFNNVSSQPNFGVVGNPQGQNANPYFQNQPVYNPALYMKKKKEYSPLTKKDNSFLAIFFVILFIFADFGRDVYSLGFTISYFLLFTFSTAYLYDKKNKPDLFSITCGVLSLASSVTLSLYSNSLMNMFSFVLIFALFTFYCLGISGSYNYSKGNYKVLFDLVLSAVAYPFKNLADVFGSAKADAKSGKKSYSALIGVVIAIPVLCIIIPLLVKSDAAFEGLVKALSKNIGRYVEELLIALVLTPFVFSAMLGKKRKINLKSNKKSVKKFFAPSGSTAFLTVISITYLVYLFSQLAYFFSAFKGILPAGYSRSASVFARRGFYETFVICAVNVLIISTVMMFTKRKNKKLSISVKLLLLFISLFSVLMIITAMQKMRLNISTYGFTRNRLLVFTFMLMMLVVIAFFIVHIFAPKVNYMQPIILICSAMFIALSFADIDSVTFNRNYENYKKGTLDTSFMEGIDDITPNETHLIELAKSGDKDLSHKAAAMLISENFEQSDYKIKDGRVVTPKSDFRSYNYSRAKANKALKEYYASLDSSDKKYFDSVYKMVKNDASYDSNSDTIYDFNGVYQYNPKTNMYDIKVKEVDEAEE